MKNETKEPKLKPCPFCGGKAELHDLGAVYGVRCESCGVNTGVKANMRAAVCTWNKRAEKWGIMEWDISGARLLGLGKTGNIYKIKYIGTNRFTSSVCHRPDGLKWPLVSREMPFESAIKFCREVERKDALREALRKKVGKNEEELK